MYQIKNLTITITITITNTLTEENISLLENLTEIFLI